MAFAVFGSSFALASNSSEANIKASIVISPCSDIADAAMEKIEESNTSLSSNELLEIRDTIESTCEAQNP